MSSNNNPSNKMPNDRVRFAQTTAETLVAQRKLFLIGKLAELDATNGYGQGRFEQRKTAAGVMMKQADILKSKASLFFPCDREAGKVALAEFHNSLVDFKVSVLFNTLRDAFELGMRKVETFESELKSRPFDPEVLVIVLSVFQHYRSAVAALQGLRNIAKPEGSGEDAAGTGDVSLPPSESKSEASDT